MGIPDEMFDEHPMLPAWALKLGDYIGPNLNKRLSYLYDFADNWEHLIEFEGIYPKKATLKYPLCLEGSRACPPENVGGVFGYKHYLDVLSNPDHPEYSEIFGWKGAFESEHFNPKKIKFSDPLERLKKLRTLEF